MCFFTLVYLALLDTHSHLSQFQYFFQKIIYFHSNCLVSLGQSVPSGLLHILESSRRIVFKKIVRFFWEHWKEFEALAHLFGDHFDAWLEILARFITFGRLQKFFQTNVNAEWVEKLLLCDRAEAGRLRFGHFAKKIEVNICRQIGCARLFQRMPQGVFAKTAECVADGWSCWRREKSGKELNIIFVQNRIKKDVPTVQTFTVAIVAGQKDARIVVQSFGNFVH